MKRWGCALFLSVVVVIALVVVFTPRPRSLLSEAKLFAQAEGYRSCWLSNTEIIELHEKDYSRFEAYRVNVDTGTKTRLKELDNALKFNIDRTISVSPDGKWLLCSPFDGEPDVHIVSMDGKQTLTWDVGGDTELSWIPGTSRWLRILPNPTYQSGNPRSLTGIKVADILQPMKPPTTLPVTTAVPYENYFLLNMVTPDNRLLLARFGLPPQSDRVIEMIECRIEQTRIVPTRTWTLYSLMEGEQLIGVPILTPQADRVAWFSRREYRSPWRTFLARWFPRISNDPVDMVMLTVAHIDGTQQQEFLCDKKDAWVDNVQWHPDGKALSFNYNGSLYLLPMP